MVKLKSLSQWETDLRYEVDTIAALPHAVAYVEAGYSDANSPSYTAQVLNAVDVQQDPRLLHQRHPPELDDQGGQLGDKISRLTHGAHFIVNTAQNGNGPMLNPHPRTQGIEDLCNPPGRGLGPPPTTDTGFPQVDAFLWTSIPGNSSGPATAGRPPATFWAARAISLGRERQRQARPGLSVEAY